MLAGNGILYFVPDSADSIGKFDPDTNHFSTIDISTAVSGDTKYSGGVLAGDGSIFFVPYFTDSIGHFQPNTEAFSTIDLSATVASGFKYSGGVLVGDVVYFVPYDARALSMCRYCRPGKYKDAEVFACTDCQAGNYSSVFASSSCSSCIAGKYSPTGVLVFVF